MQHEVVSTGHDYKEKYVKKILEEDKKYTMDLYTDMRSYYIMLWKKYAPKEKTNIDNMYGDVVESDWSFTEEEKKYIKNLSLLYLKEKYNIKVDNLF